MTLVRLNNGYHNSLNRFGSVNPWMDSWLSKFDNNTFQNAQPQANIIELEKSFLIELAIPGYSKKDIQIKAENSLLTISHEVEKEEVKEDQRFVRREFLTSGFSRSFRLSRWVDHEKITARYENGVLSIEIPKKEEAISKPAREIKIS